MTEYFQQYGASADSLKIKFPDPNVVKEILGCRDIRLSNCNIPEDIYAVALGAKAYRKACKDQKIKPSPFTLALIK